MANVLVGDSALRLSSGKKYYKDVAHRLGWNIVSYNLGATLEDLVDIACDLCMPKPAGKGHSGTLCIIAMGNGLEAVSAG